MQRALDRRVEDHASGRGDQALGLASPEHDRLLQLDLVQVERDLDLVHVAEGAERALRAGRDRVDVLVAVGQVVEADHHVLRRRRERTAVRGGQDVVRRQHQDARLGLGLDGQRQVDCHLVAVEVGVERVADERMDLDRLAIDQHGLEGLDAEAMQRRCAVQQHRVLGDDLVEDVPHDRIHRVDHLLGRLDVLHDLAVDQPAHDERLEQLERHQLGQAALVQLEPRARDDHGAARVVDALAEQVLAEAALLALEHVGERLERAIARSGHRATATSVVEEGVDGLLQHALLVVHDDLGGTEIEQPLEAVVAVDHAPVEVVQVRRGEAPTVELDHRAQLRRDHRDGVEDHPLGAVVRLAERRDDLQPLDRALLLLALRRADRVAQLELEGVEVLAAQQLAHRVGAHAAVEEHAEAPLGAEAILQLAEQALVGDDVLGADLLELLERVVQQAHALLDRLVGVLAPALRVEVGLAHLERPLLDHAHVVLGHAAVGLQAQVVREVAQLAALLGGRLGLGADDVGEQADGEAASLLDVLRGDAVLDRGGDEIAVLRGQGLVVAGQEGRHAIDLLACVALGRALALVDRRDVVGDGSEHRAGHGGDQIEVLRAQIAILADGGLAHGLAHPLGVLAGNAARDLLEQAVREIARLGERGDRLLLGPLVQQARPVLVVLVEAVLGARDEVLAATGETLLDRGQQLLALDGEMLLLGRDLLGQLRELGEALLVVDPDDHGRGEVEDLLELLGSDVEQVADAARDALEEPDVRDRSGQVDVTHALATHLLARDLDAAALADDALVADALVLAAVALPVLGRTEDALAEEAVLLGLERAVVDGLGLGDLARGPVVDLLGGCQADLDRIELVDVDHALTPSRDVMWWKWRTEGGVRSSRVECPSLVDLCARCQLGVELGRCLVVLVVVLVARRRPRRH